MAAGLLHDARCLLRMAVAPRKGSLPYRVTPLGRDILECRERDGVFRGLPASPDTKEGIPLTVPNSAAFASELL